MTSGQSLLVDIQNALEEDYGDGEKPPSASLLKSWALLAHRAVSEQYSELTLRLVDEPEMAELNQNYRGKQGSTNVLSFALEHEFDLPLNCDSSTLNNPVLLGDIVICHSVIVREAVEQNKTVMNHYAHMVTHGVLHLHGYDHLDPQSADEMEALEAKILSSGGIENPYN